MNDFFLKRMLSEKQILTEKISAYKESRELVLIKDNESEIKGHLKKAKHNINFIKDAMKMGYYDWAVVGCYYAAYHAALSMIMHKGFHSKNHDATLCVLINEYYKKELFEEEIILLNLMYLTYSDVLFYAQSKNERESASYSSQIAFDDKTVKEIKMKTILFVDKCICILKKHLNLDDL